MKLGLHAVQKPPNPTFVTPVNPQPVRTTSVPPSAGPNCGSNPNTTGPESGGRKAHRSSGTGGGATSEVYSNSPGLIETLPDHPSRSRTSETSGVGGETATITLSETTVKSADRSPKATDSTWRNEQPSSSTDVPPVVGPLDGENPNTTGPLAAGGPISRSTVPPTGAGTPHTSVGTTPSPPGPGASGNTGGGESGPTGGDSLRIGEERNPPPIEAKVHPRISRTASAGPSRGLSPCRVPTRRSPGMRRQSDPLHGTNLTARGAAVGRTAQEGPSRSGRREGDGVATRDPVGPPARQPPRYGGG